MSAASAGPLLDVRGLRTEFVGAAGVATAVRGVDLRLERGERLAIVGESGSGKSALALSIMQLVEPPGRIAGGEIWLSGRDLRTLDEAQLARVRGSELGLIYQDPMNALNPVKSVGDQLAETMLLHRREPTRRAARRRAVELLREVEVPDPARRLDDYPHQYSGGMRQRVLIAMALANSPDAVIADEPTTALDVTTQAEILSLLDRLVDELRAAVILITHNLGIVAQFCDRVNVMYAGRIVERGALDSVFARPGHPYTEALLRSVPRLDRAVTGDLPFIPGLPPNPMDLPPGCSFAARCPVGADKAICRSETPSPQPVPDDAGRSAECHFAGRLHEAACG